MVSATLKFVLKSIVSKRTDISQQIRKYLNGELDDRAMHQFEKEALNDQFLAEAIEGYEKAKTGQQDNIDDIHARLKARINKKEARIIPWRAISIAASILLFLGVGILWLANKHPYVTEPEAKKVAIISPQKEKIPADTVRTIAPKQQQIAAVASPTPPKVSRRKVTENEHEVQSNVADGAPVPVASSDNSIAANSTTPTNEYESNANAKMKAIIPASPVYKSSDSTVAFKSNHYVNPLSGQVAGVRVNPAPNNDPLGKAILADKLNLNRQGAQLGYNTSTIKASDINTSALKGLVKDETGTPLPGVTVRVKGTNIATQTDMNGKFSINLVPDNTVLNLGFIGYTTREVPVNKRDSLVIAMQPTGQSLNEVVVVGYGKKDEEYHAAQPRNGWSDLSSYLKDNAHSPDGKVGIVKLSFIVNPDNSLSDFKVLKSVSAKTDSTAINLITDGPGWYASSNGKPERVRVRIKFTGK
jgi:hypothetical protein